MHNESNCFTHKAANTTLYMSTKTGYYKYIPSLKRGKTINDFSDSLEIRITYSVNPALSFCIFQFFRPSQPGCLSTCLTNCLSLSLSVCWLDRSDGLAICFSACLPCLGVSENEVELGEDVWWSGENSWCMTLLLRLGRASCQSASSLFGFCVWHQLSAAWIHSAEVIYRINDTSPATKGHGHCMLGADYQFALAMWATLTREPTRNIQKENAGPQHVESFWTTASTSARPRLSIILTWY